MQNTVYTYGFTQQCNLKIKKRFSYGTKMSIIVIQYSVVTVFFRGFKGKEFLDQYSIQVTMSIDLEVHVK